MIKNVFLLQRTFLNFGNKEKKSHNLIAINSSTSHDFFLFLPNTQMAIQPHCHLFSRIDIKIQRTLIVVELAAIHILMAGFIVRKINHPFFPHRRRRRQRLQQPRSVHAESTIMAWNPYRKWGLAI